MVMSVLVFVFFLKTKVNLWSAAIRKFIWKISDLCFGAYLLSYVFDTIFYRKLFEKEPVMYLRLEYYFIIVPAVFLCSLGASFIINKFYDGLCCIVTLVRKDD